MKLLRESKYSSELKNFISKYSDLINNNDLVKLYSLVPDYYLFGELTDVLKQIGLDPILAQKEWLESSPSPKYWFDGSVMNYGSYLKINLYLDLHKVNLQIQNNFRMSHITTELGYTPVIELDLTYYDVKHDDDIIIANMKNDANPLELKSYIKMRIESGEEIDRYELVNIVKNGSYQLRTVRSNKLITDDSNLLQDIVLLLAKNSEVEVVRPQFIKVNKRISPSQSYTVSVLGLEQFNLPYKIYLDQNIFIHSTMSIDYGIELSDFLNEQVISDIERRKSK